MGTDDSGLTDAGRDSSMPGSDGGGDGGDECEGLTLCDTLGTSCDGDELVTCATNSDGCRVEVRDDCGADGDVCSVTGSTASCIDPCLLIPTAMRCDAAGRSCNGDSLEICTANEDGCFVLEATDCAAVPDGTCGMGDTMLQCLLPVDPCEAIPAAERCTVEGTTCVGNDLVTCAPDALGCLVTSEVDCTSRPGGSCDDVTTPAAPICVATNACAGITQCAAAGAECDGPELVTCSADAFGCLVETTEDCTAATFGFCDEDAAPVDACSTAATDPCMGVTQCGSAASRTCGTDGTTLTICEANAFGCFVAADTDCTTDGDVCDATGTMAMCVDPCSLVTVCPAATYCDGNAIVSCAADANSCLVETSRTACATGEVCDGTGAAPMCVTPDLCPQALPTVLNCASGTVTGNTMGGTTARTAYPGCETYTDYAGAERIWRFAHTGPTQVEVEIVATRLTGSGDFDLYAWEDDGIASCTATTSLSCLDSSALTGAVETVGFIAAPGDAAYVAYDIFSTSTTPPTAEFTLAITCTPFVCGDGIIANAEECDDGNAIALDGCSDTCEIETGSVCYGEPSNCGAENTCGNGIVETGETCDDDNATASDGCTACAVDVGFNCFHTPRPSSCFPQSTAALCADATDIAANTTLLAQDVRTGGARPTPTSCGGTTGTRVHYYEVTIPAGASVVIDATPTAWDLEIMRLETCTSTSCSVTDSNGVGVAERMTVANSTTSPFTRIIAIGNDTTATGTYDVSFTFVVCGDGAVGPGEVCDDGNTAAGDGCSATCGTVETGYSCNGGGAGSCTMRTYTAAPITAACVDASAGTVLHASGVDDANSAVAALPFTFSYFGAAATHYRVSSNGYAQLATSSTIAGSESRFNGALPSSSTPNGVLASFWDDLIVDTAGVRSITTGAPGSQRFVIEWNAYPIAESSAPMRVQAHLVEGTNVIEYHYCTVGTTTRAGGDSATIGIENVTGTAGVETSRDAAGAVMTGSGFRYTPNP